MDPRTKAAFVLFGIAVGGAFVTACGGDVAVLQTRSGVGGGDAGRDAEPGPTDGGGVDSGGGRPVLVWYTTCGDPICRTDGDAGAQVSCAPVGSSCSEKGVTCGNPAANCGVVEVCEDHDPKLPGCPISSKKYKNDVAYLDAAELQRLHDETVGMRLATYKYKGPFIDPADPKATHLGFIVEDQPQSLSVDRGHDRVDLYGYVSMAVATLQVQEREIAALRREVAEAKASCVKKH